MNADAVRDFGLAAACKAAEAAHRRAPYPRLLRELAASEGVDVWPPSESRRYERWIRAHGSPELRALDAALRDALRDVALDAAHRLAAHLTAWQAPD